MKKEKIPEPIKIDAFSDKLKNKIKDSIDLYFDNMKNNMYLGSHAYDIISIKEVCSRLKISKSTAYRWMRIGILPYLRVVKIICFRGEDLDKFLDKPIKRMKFSNINLEDDTDDDDSFPFA